MNKAVVFLMVIALTGFVLVSCVKEVVTYCPFCGQANLKEVSNFNMTSGKSEVYYQCQNSNCGKAFGAGQP